MTFSLASNHLADRTDSEIRTLRSIHWDNLLFTSNVFRGLLHDPLESNNGGLAQEFTQAEVAAAPDTLDWRSSYDAVNFCLLFEILFIPKLV